MLKKKNKRDNHSKHLAFQIAAQLPEETAEALEVLDYARRLILSPMDEPEPPTPLRVVNRV